MTHSKIIIKSLLVLFITSIFISCSNDKVVSSSMFQKRKYSKGYHVSNPFKRYKNDKLIAKTKDLSNEEYLLPNDNYELTASNSSEQELIVESVLKTNILKKLIQENIETKCDELILRDGNIILVKVQEVGISEIKYKKCSNLSGPTYSVKKDDVFLIKYSNGEKDVFEKEKKNEAAYFPTNSDVDSEYNNKSGGYSGTGIASFILGLLSYSIALWVSGIAGIAMAILAIVFGIASMSGKKKGKGFGIAGFILGILSLTSIILILIALLA